MSKVEVFKIEHALSSPIVKHADLSANETVGHTVNNVIILYKANS